MTLTQKQVQSILFGAVQTELSDDGFRFFKYTKKQLAFFSSLDEGFGRRACTTTGVHLDFHTDAKSLRFSVCGGGKYELFINGLLVAQYKADEAYTIAYAPSQSAVYRVTLVLPSHGIGSLKEVTLEDATLFYPHPFRRRFLFIGDSITQGWNTEFDGLSYAYRISDLYDAQSVIQGTGGAFFHEDSFDSIPFSPDVVFVALGTNDFVHFQSIEEMTAHANAHLALIAKEYKGKPLYYISPIWREKQESAMGSFALCREALIACAKQHGFTHIDGFALVPHHPSFFMEDLLHPNALGFAQYAENLFRILNEQGDLQ